jgi:hypothetical protein
VIVQIRGGGPGGVGWSGGDFYRPNPGRGVGAYVRSAGRGSVSWPGGGFYRPNPEPNEGGAVVGRLEVIFTDRTPAEAAVPARSDDPAAGFTDRTSGDSADPPGFPPGPRASRLRVAPHDPATPETSAAGRTARATGSLS